MLIALYQICSGGVQGLNYKHCVIIHTHMELTLWMLGSTGKNVT